MSRGVRQSYLFESKQLYFQEICKEDAEFLVKWRSKPDLIKYFRNSKPLTMDDHLTWYHQIYIGNQKRFDYIIIHKKSNDKIGTVGACNIDLAAHSCEISYMIAEAAYQRRGLASEAIVTLIGYMGERSINTFYAEVHQDNFASIRTIEKLGFVCSSQDGDFFRYVKNWGN